ncbi:MAG: GTPase Era [Pseudomonadota bacterium]
MNAFRSGFVGILGRPNVGKSTLLNYLCGEKLSITSSKPQTTRNRILGVLHRPGFQIVFLDTPGVHETDRAINRYMKQVIAKVAADADIVLYLADASRAHGLEDELALSVLPPESGTPVILVVNKSDLVKPGAVRDRISLLSGMYDFEGAFAVSALTGAGTAQLVEKIATCLPESVPYFPEDMVTDQPLGFRLAEIVREKLFEMTKEEIPYSTAVVVENMAARKDGLMEIEATVFVERESQKGIVIGRKGSMLQRIGTSARHEIEQQLGKKVYLELRVKVKKKWTDRDRLLKEMGYE